MPRGDGTGPMSMGPMTGAGRGRCTGGIGVYGRRPVRAGGYGCKRMYYETGLPGWARSAENVPEAGEKELLTAETEMLENRLRQLREKMDTLEEKTQNPEAGV